MSSTAAGWLQFALLVAALAACYVPLGNYIARIFTAKEHWRVERGIYKLCGIDPEADMRWSVYVRSVLAFSLVSVLFLYLLQRTQHFLFLSVGLGNVTPDDRVEHGGVVHHEHQLAELLRRVHHELPDPDVGARGAELPVRRGRAGGRDRDDPRVHPVPDGQARQLLGGPDPGHHPAAAAAVGPRRADPGGRRRDRELRRLPHDHHPGRRCTRPSSAARWPRRRSSRSWATTAAASSTPTRPIRSRTRTRSRTSSRSS